MLAEKAYSSVQVEMTLQQKLSDYSQLAKLRLSGLVIFSAAASYLSAPGGVHWLEFFFLCLGGFLITSASNAINQIIEQKFDAIMTRTANRPLPTRRMQPTEAIIFASLTGIVGTIFLWFGVNWLCGVLGFISLVLYAFVYTPLKRYSPIAVWVGAIPGAIPPAIGWVAATQSLNPQMYVLFILQFIWQFPHFWAIAWVKFEDYAKAGYYLLPVSSGKSKTSAIIIASITFLCIPASFLPYYYQISGITSAIICMIAGFLFFLLTLKLIKTLDKKDALRIMFASFIYLPLIQLAILFDKL